MYSSLTRVPLAIGILMGFSSAVASAQEAAIVLVVTDEFQFAASLRLTGGRPVGKEPSGSFIFHVPGERLPTIAKVSDFTITRVSDPRGTGIEFLLFADGNVRLPGPLVVRVRLVDLNADAETDFVSVDFFFEGAVLPISFSASRESSKNYHAVYKLLPQP